MSVSAAIALLPPPLSYSPPRYIPPRSTLRNISFTKIILANWNEREKKTKGTNISARKKHVFAQLSFVLSLIRQEFEQLPYRKRNSSWEHACPYVKMNDVYTSRNVRDGRTGRNIDSLLTLRTSRIEILSNRVGREYLHRRCTVRYKQIFSSLCNNHCYYLNFESKRTVLWDLIFFFFANIILSLSEK